MIYRRSVHHRALNSKAGPHSPVKMLLDIFSSFDDHNGVTHFYSFFVWIIPLLIILTISCYWTKATVLTSARSIAIAVVEDLVRRTASKNVGGATAIFTRLFIALAALNIMGLVPHIFRLTRHLAINLSISLPLWTRIILIRITYDLPSFLAHFQPIGSPAPLNPFLCVIELVRILVRPLTLAVRLTANLRTGHILIALLGTGFARTSLYVASILVVLGIFYFMFEIAICVIQAYIFTLLPTLYLDEHPRDNH